MPEKPVSHGRDHRPGGFDPTETGPWHDVVMPGTYSAWIGSHVYSPGDKVEHDVFVYFCIVQNNDVEPNVTSGWPQYWVIDASLFQNGGQSSPGSEQVQWRLVVGPPHILDNTGAVITHSKHKLEIQGPPESGAMPVGVALFTLPPSYAPPETYIITYTDDMGSIFPLTVQDNGDVIPGSISSVTGVTSSDGSVTVSNPTGPTVDLSVTVIDGGSA